MEKIFKYLKLKLNDLSDEILLSLLKTQHNQSDCAEHANEIAAVQTRSMTWSLLCFHCGAEWASFYMCAHHAFIIQLY